MSPGETVIRDGVEVPLSSSPVELVTEGKWNISFYPSANMMCGDYSETKKYPPGRDFSMQNLTVFANLSKIYWVLEKNVLISIEALICGYFEPKKLRARLPNKAATPS